MLFYLLGFYIAELVLKLIVRLLVIEQQSMSFNY